MKCKMKFITKILILQVLVTRTVLSEQLLPEKLQTSIRYEAPDDCQWYIREPIEVQQQEEVSLTCKLRTINSEFDTTNFSVIPSEHTTSLRIECSDVIMSRSSLGERSFQHLSKLRELALDNCKLGRWPGDTLEGLRDLRNLTVRTRNTDWPAMSLELSPGSFTHVKQLERLDLSYNNMWSFPEGLFCPLTNLVSLNVSMNRLQDVSDLGFREKVPSSIPKAPQPLISNPEELESFNLPPNPKVEGSSPVPCNLGLHMLDSSYNHFVLLPPTGFGLLKRLQELYIHNNEISMVADKALSGLRSLKILDLSNNKIVALPPELFKDCTTTIAEIYLQNNSISVLAPGLFSNLNQLLALDLSRNQLTSAWINHETFSGLIRLVLLNLSHNRIAHLDPKFFKDLYTLQILNLEHNQLEILPADTFTPMANLHTLLLSFNRLTYLDAYSLNGLYVLSLLSLDNNQLEGIHPEAFRNCSGLQDLNLNGNHLKAIPLALKDMRLLRTVDLGENLIGSLEPGFRGMTNLYGLRLIGNQLTKVERGIFDELPSLQILNLARNKIRIVENGAFKSLGDNLQAIRLDANNLTDISGLFGDVGSLLWLNVSDNQIEWFDYSLIPRGLQWLDLHKNGIRELGNHYGLNYELSLQTLDVSFNRLTSLGPNSIPASVGLLFLNDNQITSLEPYTFLKKPNLTRVDLYANNINGMDLNALRLTPVQPGIPLPEFYIGGNPFQCDCRMEWLQRINKLDHLRQHPRVMDLDTIYCRLLYSRERSYIPLLEAEPSDFLCGYKTHCFALCQCCDFDACDCEMTCPQNCTCYHDQSWGSNLVDCSEVGYLDIPRIPMDATEVYLDGNNFGELSSHAFIGRKNLKVLYANNSNVASLYNDTFAGLRRLVVLHLEYNNIQQLLGQEFVSLVNIREVYLQGNKIYYIDDRTFLPLKHLEVLRLDGNKLVTFPVWQLSLDSYLVEIGLSNNPWSCNCQFVEKFKNWLQMNFRKVLDGDSVKCISSGIEGPPFSKWNSTCGIPLVESMVVDSYLPLFLGSLFVFLGSISLVCVGFFYRNELRVWFFSRCGFRMCYKTTSFEEQQDKDRLFDAYIAYSLKDEIFVHQILASSLESGDPGYRLCLHYRDFNVSAYIADTILEAVESSCRTLLVLSKNFLQNEWCRFEFKSALHEVLKDKRRRLIIILYDISPHDLDHDLRLHLKSNTVLQCSDKNFWQKLRFAMPDVNNIYKMLRHTSAVNIYDRRSPRSPEIGLQIPLPPNPPTKLPPFLQHSNSSTLNRDLRSGHFFKA